MTKYQISDLLEQLRSNETYTRNDAIKKIFKEKINDEQIIIALKLAIENDPSMSVRTCAGSTLDMFGIEHSAVEKPAAINLESSDSNLRSSKSDDVKMTGLTVSYMQPPANVNTVTNYRWTDKAVGYLIVVDVLLSIIIYSMLADGANSLDMNVVLIMLFVAIPVAPLSIGIALRGENQSPTKQRYSKILIAIGFVIFVPLCLFVLLLTFVSD